MTRKVPPNGCLGDETVQSWPLWAAQLHKLLSQPDRYTALQREGRPMAPSLPFAQRPQGLDGARCQAIRTPSLSARRGLAGAQLPLQRPRPATVKHFRVSSLVRRGYRSILVLPLMYVLGLAAALHAYCYRASTASQTCGTLYLALALLLEGV